MDEDHEIEDINEDDVEVLAGAVVIAGAILFVSVLYISALGMLVIFGVLSLSFIVFSSWNTSTLWLSRFIRILLNSKFCKLKNP